LNKTKVYESKDLKTEDYLGPHAGNTEREKKKGKRTSQINLEGKNNGN